MKGGPVSVIGDDMLKKLKAGFLNLGKTLFQPPSYLLSVWRTYTFVYIWNITEWDVKHKMKQTRTNEVLAL